MKVYRIVLCVVDTDEVGLPDMVSLIEEARLPNHVSPGTVMEAEERDIGEWYDAHPLNNSGTMTTTFNTLFNKEPMANAQPGTVSSDARVGTVNNVCNRDCGHPGAVADTEKTATHIGGEAGDGSGACQRHYALSAPINGHDYVVVSAVVAYGRPETYIFGADVEGKIVDWCELPGSFQGALDHVRALGNVGYTVTP